LELVDGWVGARKWGRVVVVRVIDSFLGWLRTCIVVVGMLCCRFGGIVVSTVVVGEGFVFCIRWVVAIFFGIMVLCPIFIV
jgi:hypothetical protein